MPQGREGAQVRVGGFTHREVRRQSTEVGRRRQVSVSLLPVSASAVNRKEGHKLRERVGRRCLGCEREKV